MPKRVIKTAPNDIETALYSQGFSVVAGVDEVGRGPLCGPVMACAVILPEGLIIEGVNDSKKMTEARREKLAEEIKQAAISYAFGIVEAEEIDRINILQATLKAMEIAVGGLKTAPQAVLVDGISAPKIDAKTICVKKGDSASHLIAAASILAKVARDNIMQTLHNEFPFYEWQNNKGYGTAAHIAAIKEHGLSPHHRRSFCKGFL
ncbi:MAG: ribonuclease HII [Defluviitaleaceae bacterium]|nr:ribonuclease HII [Defluviitaleaceae bacterium]MCL2263666.1 ribonuclease HII [Defluviitaleaceae bacterium]